MAGPWGSSRGSRRAAGALGNRAEASSNPRQADSVHCGGLPLALPGCSHPREAAGSQGRNGRTRARPWRAGRNYRLLLAALVRAGGRLRFRQGRCPWFCLSPRGGGLRAGAACPARWSYLQNNVRQAVLRLCFGTF